MSLTSQQQAKPQQLSLLFAVILIGTSFLSLVQGATGFLWSEIFLIYVTAYKTAFHLSIDWLFGWLVGGISWWFKDLLILFGSHLWLSNLTERQTEGKSFWTDIKDLAKGSYIKKIRYIFCAVFLFPVLVPWIFFFSDDKRDMKFFKFTLKTGL